MLIDNPGTNPFRKSQEGQEVPMGRFKNKDWFALERGNKLFGSVGLQGYMLRHRYIVVTAPRICGVISVNIMNQVAHSAKNFCQLGWSLPPPNVVERHHCKDKDML